MLLRHVDRRRLLSTAAGALAAGVAASGLSRCAPGTQAGTGGASAPSIIFGRDGNIHVIAPDGSGVMALTRFAQGTNARDPVWSPDGKSITFAYSPPLPATRGPGGLVPLPVTGVYTMARDGGDPKVLIPHDTPGVGYETPVWAPDGKSLFVTYTELKMESNIVKDQINEVARLTPGNNQRETLIPRGAFPTVSPDGRRLACIVDGPEGQALVLADVDGKNLKTLIKAGTMTGLASPRFAPDGKRLVFSAIAPMAPIPTVTPFPGRPASSAPVDIPNSSPDGAPTRASWPSFSKLSRVSAATFGPLANLFRPRVARAHGLPMDVFVTNTEPGAVPKRLTNLGEDSPSAAWAPDGKRLIMLAGGGLYVLSAEDGKSQSIDPRGGHGSVDWRAS